MLRRLLKLCILLSTSGSDFHENFYLCSAFLKLPRLLGKFPESQVAPQILEILGKTPTSGSTADVFLRVFLWLLAIASMLVLAQTLASAERAIYCMRLTLCIVVVLHVGSSILTQPVKICLSV